MYVPNLICFNYKWLQYSCVVQMLTDWRTNIRLNDKNRFYQVGGEIVLHLRDVEGVSDGFALRSKTSGVVNQNGRLKAGIRKL